MTDALGHNIRRSASQARIKTVLIDDHAAIRDFLRIAIGNALGHEIVGEASEAGEGLDLILRTKPDFAILDLRLPDRSGFSIIPECRRRMEKPPRFLIFSGFCDTYSAFCAERLHVGGYIDKSSCAMSLLLEAVRTVSGGSSYFCDQFQEEKAARLRDPLSFDKVLTNQELNVVIMVGRLCDDSEIARKLGISVGTVEKHRLSIISKLKLRGRIDLERYAVEHGLAFAELHPGLAA